MRRPPKAPKYCQGFADRHGKTRWYLRKPGCKRAPLPGMPWTPEFMAAYESALAGEVQIAAKKTSPGSISDLVARYYQTPEFVGLSKSTKTTYRGIIEGFRKEHGDKRVARLEREHVRRIVAAKSATPSAANNLLRMIRMLMQHAMDMEMRNDDPTKGIRKFKSKTQGFITWEEEHIEQFGDYHKPGTRAHLALTILLYTGQRRSDVVRMGWQHIRKGILVIRQQKTSVEVHIPVLPKLSAALDRTGKSNLTFILTAHGKPFTPAGFTNWFRDCVNEAGLPKGLSPHGLRKAMCRRLAEGGVTPHGIMAISGHKTLQEVTRYTAAANREQLAKDAMATLERTGTRTEIVKPNGKV